jgi:hypothetical protein
MKKINGSHVHKGSEQETGKMKILRKKRRDRTHKPQLLLQHASDNLAGLSRLRPVDLVICTHENNCGI